MIHFQVGVASGNRPGIEDDLAVGISSDDIVTALECEDLPGGIIGVVVSFDYCELDDPVR